MKKAAALSLLFFLSLYALHAQADFEPGMGEAVHFDMTGFPQWSRDLRRASIVAFGAFPFMYLFSTFSFDSYRFATNSWDRRYAPWPFTAAGGVGHSQSDRFRVLGIAAGSAVFISIIDHGIVRHRRNRLAREARALAPGTPIIIRTPLHGEEAEPPEPEAGDL
ncbi:MAG: hypothetical protein FWB99_07935 [Treponema sp.]|nr:hypothetical protein [Treponema sp.]